MCQRVVCRNINGIVQGGDGKTLTFVPPEEVTEVEITRLLQLNKHAAAWTERRGSRAAIQLCHHNQGRI